MTRSLIVMLFVISFLNRAEANDGYGKYQSLIKGINTAEGRVVVYLNSGYFQLRNGRNVILLNTDPKSADEKKVEVEFKYNNGSLVYLKVNFRPEIHIVLLSNKCISLRVKTLVFDVDGDFISEQCEYDWDTQKCKSPNTSILLEALKPNLDIQDLLTGNLFKNQGKFIFSNEDGQPLKTDKKFISRVLFNNPTKSGLLVTFKQGSNWQFSEMKDEKSSNSITFNAGSYINFKRIDYNINENTLEVKLDDGIFNLAAGSLNTGKISINLLNNTTLKIGSMNFLQNGKDYFFEYKNANLDANISAGSSITLTEKAVSMLTFDNGSSVALQGVDFQVDNNLMQFSFAQGSSFKINILAGNLPIGDNGNFSLKQGSINLNIGGVYKKGGDISVIGSIVTCDLNLGAGKFFFNDSQNPLLIKAGKVQARGLIVNSQIAPYITGAFDSIRLACDTSSELSIKDSFQFDLLSGSTLIFENENFPFTLISNEKYPIGSFTCSLNFSNFKNHKNGTFSIGEGHADGNFRLLQKEKCTVDSLNLNAAFILDYSIQNVPTKTKGKVFFRNGTLKYVNDSPSFNAFVSFEIIRVNNYIPIQIEGAYENGKYIEKEKVTVYPVNIEISLANNLKTPETQLEFTKNLISITPLEFDLNAHLVIPPGGGEREFPDGHFNGDSGNGMQEVARYDCTDPIGVMHFYIKGSQTPYTVSTKIRISGDKQQNFLISANGLTLDRNLEYDTVGCKGAAQIIAGLAALIGSSVICLTCALPTSIIVYIEAGDLVNGIIQGKIYSFLAEFNQSVTFKSKSLNLFTSH